MTVNKTLAAALLALCAVIIAACGDDQVNEMGHEELFGNNELVKSTADFCREAVVIDGYVFADSGMPLPSDGILFQDYAYEECIYAAFDLIEDGDLLAKMFDHTPPEHQAQAYVTLVNFQICRNRLAVDQKDIDSGVPSSVPDAAMKECAEFLDVFLDTISNG